MKVNWRRLTRLDVVDNVIWVHVGRSGRTSCVDDRSTSCMTLYFWTGGDFVSKIESKLEDRKRINNNIG